MATTKTKATMKSYENKCATNYSIITNNNWNDTHNKQLTMHNKYPMTTLTSTIAWCTSCVESAHRAHCSTRDDDTAHLMAQVLSNHIVIHGHTHGAFSLTRSLPSSFTGPSCPSQSSSSIPSCSLSSTTISSWQVCATPPQMRVRTPELLHLSRRL